MADQDQATTEIATWQGNAIQVTARLVPRCLWTTASIDVFVGDQCVLRTGGRMKLIGFCCQKFTCLGQTHSAEVSWGAGRLYSFPYQVRIDGVPVKEGRVRVQNWPVGFIVPLVLLVVLVLLFWLLRRRGLTPELESKIIAATYH
jgi:hypothetical protein